MDALGKIFDFFVLLVILFIFPINWALGTAEIVGDYSLKGMVENFLDSVMSERKIKSKDLKSLEEGVTELFKHYELTFMVKRGITELETDGINEKIVSFENEITTSIIEKDIDRNGYFSLYKNDVLIIKVFDLNGLFLSGARLII